MTLQGFIDEINADTDTIQQALRLHLSEITDDLPPDELRARLAAAAKDRTELEKELQHLEGDSVLVEQAAIAYFTEAWEDPARQNSIRASFDHAKTQLPVIEAALIALVAMYGMYLIKTGGVVEETQREVEKDGVKVQERTIKREPFLPIAQLIKRVFGPS